MNNRFAALGGLLILGTLTVGAWLLSAQPHAEPTRTDQIVVAASIFPLADIARHIGGEHVRVVQLLPAGASPHSYTVTPQQLTELTSAQALFVIGHGADNWATEAVKQVAGIPTITVDKNIELRQFGTDNEDAHDHEESEVQTGPTSPVGSIDPHYWLTVPNATHIATTIASTLQEIDPAHQAVYAENVTNYLAELNQLEAELQTLVTNADTTHFIAIHDAWSYLTHHYGLELVATYEPIEGRRPTAQDLQALQSVITTYNLNTFYTEPQKESSATTQFMQHEFGLNIEILDPIGGLPPRDNYIELMRTNVKALTN